MSFQTSRASYRVSTGRVWGTLNHVMIALNCISTVCPQYITAWLLWLLWCGNENNCGCINSLRPRQNGRHFADDTFKHILMNENVRIEINTSLKFVPKGLINNIPALVQIMAWRQLGDRPLSDPMMVNLLTHICVTVSFNSLKPNDAYMCQWTIPSLVQIMAASCLVGSKPLYKAMLEYC